MRLAGARAYASAIFIAAVACFSTNAQADSTRSALQRDVQAYAIASCLSYQPQPYLHQQGEAWASVIIQRSKGNLDAFASIAKQVKLELGKAEMAWARNELGPDKDQALPVLYCYEISDKPSLRAVLQKAMQTLKPFYATRLRN